MMTCENHQSQDVLSEIASALRLGVAGAILACLALSANAQTDPPAADAASTPVETAPVTPGEALHASTPRKGWFWYKDPVKKEAPEKPKEILVVPTAPPSPKKPEPVVSVHKPLPLPGEPVDRERLCGQKETWVTSCGFVDPGDDFDFQAKQRDALLQLMSLRPDSPDAVEAAQRYMKWVVGKASQAANMWYFNMVQHPDLDPRVSNPISEVGLALASRVEQASSKEYFRLMKEEGGVLFYITRNDCAYCHDQVLATRRVAHTMGLTLINVPIDGVCLDGFEGETCGDNVPPEAIARLNVQIVPALYLYVPPATWIRLATGITDDSTILANTVNFFSAYRAAMINGLDNSKDTRPSVTFDPNLRPRPTGVTAADGSAPAATPDRTEMLKLLGFKPKGE